MMMHSEHPRLVGWYKTEETNNLIAQHVSFSRTFPGTFAHCPRGPNIVRRIVWLTWNDLQKLGFVAADPIPSPGEASGIKLRRSAISSGIRCTKSFWSWDVLRHFNSGGCLPTASLVAAFHHEKDCTGLAA